MKTISIIIPAHDEEQNIPHIAAAINETFATLPQYDYEIVFVDDGSTDASAQVARSLAAADPHIRLIEFTRNFGKEMATTAGLHAARGDAAIMLDADMQHPPALIPRFLSEWEAGAEMVVGVRKRNADSGIFSRIASASFYRLLARMSETEVVPGETDFRLLDRAVLDEFAKLSEHERLTRALINWLGFRKTFVEFDAPSRAFGEAKFSFGHLLHLALHSFISHSYMPLRAAGYLGVVTSLFAGLLGFIVFIERYILLDPFNWRVSGSAQLALIIVFLVGIILICLGIFGLYVGLIKEETAARPLYVIRKGRGE